MKRNLRSLTMLSLIAGSLVIFSCKNEENKDDAPQPMQNEMHQPDDQTTTGEYGGDKLEAEFKDENTAEIYNLYVEIKDAFVNTDAEAAGEKAAELAEKAGENEEIAAIATTIAESDDVKKQREEFSKLTVAMEPVLTDALESGEIYKQYCPMAFEGKGDYWYSNSKDIFNPYYGDKMLKCGRVEATIQ
ncbi:DUF3347 domain-containing protein [Salegentibacter sp. JZCK2]|uniref:DUF3347 domain-containing protein n=1 Tax=Salegentibacter tibetensis TaxID=2873600 RepID=UPI001CCFA992|nr:DUF3347 domain-containing protein [Salegentibacter tibetensis]MBZ9730742.1 DUF3347 domain-containing protein [Salegentibacter tibetensis]